MSEVIHYVPVCMLEAAKGGLRFEFGGYIGLTHSVWVWSGLEE